MKEPKTIQELIHYESSTKLKKNIIYFSIFLPTCLQPIIQKMICENQLGIRPRWSSCSTALVDLLIIEIYGLIFKILFILENDKSVYYDIVILNLTTPYYRLHEFIDNMCKIEQWYSTSKETILYSLRQECVSTGTN